MLIVLMGYMGSGKSSVGKKLSQNLNTFFYDLDVLIENETQSKISELFEDKGEIYFRKIENTVLKKTLETIHQGVLTLGGGTPCYANNTELLKTSKHLKTVYLKASIPELAKRLITEKDNRPLLSHIPDEQAMIEFIGKHLFERSAYYSQADHIITTDKLTIDEVAEKIIKKLL